MTTYQDIISLGFAKSSAARPDTMTSPAELVARVNQCLLEWWQVIGRENPYVLGTKAQMAFNGTGWARPANCLRAIDVRADATTVVDPVLTPGTEIAVVPYDDQFFCEGRASVTELGQQYLGVGQTVDPTAGTLTLTFARTPVLGAQSTDSVDALFPVMFNDFLQYDMAAYLAEKDDRADDVQAFLALKSAQLQLSMDWAKAQTYNLQQRFPVVTPPVTNVDDGRQASRAS